MVERQRVLQQSLEQQDLLGSAAVGVPGTCITQIRGPIPGGSFRPPPFASEDSVSQVPFCSSEPGLDFLQSSSASRPPHKVQGPAGGPLPPQTSLHQGFTGGSRHPRASPTAGLLPAVAAERGKDVAAPTLQSRLRLLGQVHPTGISPHLFGHDSSSSSPLTPLPSSGGPDSLINLSFDIIPDNQPMKNSRSSNRAEEAGARTPLSPHSDITAPPTPAVSDKSSSTPTHQSDVPLSGLALSPDLERQLPASSTFQQRGNILGMEGQIDHLSVNCLEVKEEQMEAQACRRNPVKMEEGGCDNFSPPASQGGDGGKELLRHLLRDKTSPVTMPSPTRHTQPTAHRQLFNDSVRSVEKDGSGFHFNTVALTDGPGPKKIQRSKRANRPDKDRAPPKSKRRKREEEDEEKSMHCFPDPLMSQLRQLSVLPLMEPILQVDLSLLPPYGNSTLGRDSRLRGSFGNASLDGVSDFYSQLIYKNDLSNPPTPPASLPPTPPPVNRQKMVNGFATMEELSRKDISEQEGEG
ncbi:hypothetical protein ILYODFUR_012128 [Ilyodon furcidens]|uniref:Uncharacterized protein n=1 Tax=Ilyodon furcidens TaxID=33524 RepID=A0ABV0SNY7_9TELE